MSEYLYIFLDEGGNFDFSASGSRYFSLSCVIMRRPFDIDLLLDSYKYDCLEWGLPQEYFHCADDNKHVRERVFSIISGYAPGITLESLIVDKRNVPLKLQDAKRFYPVALGNLLTYVLHNYNTETLQKVIVITDTIPVNRKRRAIEKGIKHTLKAMLPDGIQYRLFHHASRAHYGLQIADYCNWAVLRKYEIGDASYYDKMWITHKCIYNTDLIDVGE